MRRAVICLWMMIKRMGKHPVYWALLLLFPAAAFTVPKVNRAVEEEQIAIGYVMEEMKSMEQGEDDGQKYTGQLLAGIENKLSGEAAEKNRLFRYIKYTEEDGMKKDILTGELSGGVVFGEEFAGKLQAQDYHHCILLYLPEGMNLGGMIQEDVFRQVYQVYSAVWYSELLGQQGRQIEPEEVLEKFSEYQMEGKVFTVNYEAAKRAGREKKNSSWEENGQVLSLRSVLAFLVFLSASLGALEGSRDRKKGAGKGISAPNTLAMAAVGAPIIPAVLFLTAGVLSGSGGFVPGELLQELCSALAYGFMLWLLGLAAAGIFPEKLLEGIMPCFLLIALLCCPVFFDLGETVPLIGYFSKLFPLTWYLNFWG